MLVHEVHKKAGAIPKNAKQLCDRQIAHSRATWCLSILQGALVRDL